MKALTYNGPRDVSVTEVADPVIEQPTDALVRITTTNICGSDLHMYEGRTDFESGRVIGHENQGEVIAVGDSVDQVRVGDMVTLPFNVACGYCQNCERGLTSYCLTMNPADGVAGAAYGYADMGPYQGGQAEYLRVPHADFNALVLPEDAREKENDYVMLADIWPTGHHATELAGVEPGDSVVVAGAGPVGLLAAYSAMLKGAGQVFVVDRHPDRLGLAESIGAIPMDDTQVSPVDQIMDATDGIGADAGCECVGYQAHDAGGHEDPAMTMNTLIHSVRYGGGLGVVGVFPPEDPGGRDESAKEGRIGLDWGELWFKALRVGTGQAPVKHYNRELCQLIHEGKATPSFLVSHELPLDEAPDAYRHFDARDDGWTKVVLKPNGTHGHGAH